MSRLTEKDRIECGFWVPGCNGYYSYFTHGDNFYNVVAKLAYYEDLEEQGRLIEQKHGYWTGPDDYDCSVCGENYMEIADADAYASGWKPNYCPNCGAKMDEVEK